jgi:hypothetical protein
VAAWREPLQGLEQVRMDVGIGILLDQERRRGMADEQREQPILGADASSASGLPARAPITA